MYKDQGYEIMGKLFEVKDTQKINSEEYVKELACEAISYVMSERIVCSTVGRDVSGGIAAFAATEHAHLTIRTFPKKRSAFLNIYMNEATPNDSIKRFKFVADNLGLDTKRTFTILFRN